MSFVFSADKPCIDRKRSVVHVVDQVNTGTAFEISWPWTRLWNNKKIGQHSLKINYMRNCKGKSLQSNILQLQNLTFTLTDDCRLVPRGCYLIKKKSSDIKVNYFVSKPPILNKNGTEDLCKAMGDSKFQSMAAQYKSLDTKCPIEAGQYCISKGSTVISQLNPSILNMATGNLRVRVEMESDKGKQKSCIEMEAVISKKH